MVTETASSPGPFRNAQMSKAAQTHKLRKLRAPSKCRECDSLVVFHGAECEEVQYTYSFICSRNYNVKYGKVFHDELEVLNVADRHYLLPFGCISDQQV